MRYLICALLVCVAGVASGGAWDEEFQRIQQRQLENARQIGIGQQIEQDKEDAEHAITIEGEKSRLWHDGKKKFSGTLVLITPHSIFVKNKGKEQKIYRSKLLPVEKKYVEKVEQKKPTPDK